MRCFRMRCAPAGCRRASMVQAGRPGAGRNKAVAHSMCSDVQVCSSMCPLNQDKISALKVYTGTYSVHTSIYFIWEFHTEIYGHILSYTYNCKSRHIRRYTFGQLYMSRYAEYILRYTISLIFILSYMVASYNSRCTDYIWVYARIYQYEPGGQVSRWWIVVYKRGWYPEAELNVFEHQMSLRQRSSSDSLTMTAMMEAAILVKSHFKKWLFSLAVPRGANKRLELSKSSNHTRFTVTDSEFTE